MFNRSLLHCKKRKRELYALAARKKRKTSAATIPELILPLSIQTALICSVTGEMFDDPVVYKNGKTYEKVILTTFREGIDFSPNRILKEIIQAIQEKKWDALSELLECPISLEQMKNPLIVIAQDGGQSFDRRKDILKYIRDNKTNPLNNTPITEANLVENKNLKSFIEASPKLLQMFPKKMKKSLSI